MTIRKIWGSRVDQPVAETYVGQKGTIFFNEPGSGASTWPRVSDGHTAGGIPLNVPPATSSIVGGIRPGSGFTVNSNGVLTLNAGPSFAIDNNNTYQLLAATSSTIGGIKAGPGVLVASDGTLVIDSSGLSFSFGDFYADANNFSTIGVNENINIVSNGTGTVNVIGDFAVYKTDGSIQGSLSTASIFQVNSDGQVSILVTAFDQNLGAVEIIGSTTGQSIAPGQTGAMLHITGQFSITNRIYYDGNNSYVSLVGRRWNGHVYSPTQVLANDDIFRINATAQTDQGMPGTSTVQIRFYALETQTSSAQGGAIDFIATPVGQPATNRVTAATITATGTNFLSGFSKITWGGVALTTSYVSSTSLTASVPAANIAANVSSPTPSVGVTSSGIGPDGSTTVSTSTSSNQTYTISVPTPTVTGISPASIADGAGNIIDSITGTNFISGVSVATWGSSTAGVTTTYINATTLRAVISSSLLAGSTSVTTSTLGVSNIGAGSTVSGTVTANNFTIYPHGAVWSLTSNSSATVPSGSNLTANAPSVTGFAYNQYSATAGTGYGLALCPSANSSSTTWNVDGGPSSAPVTPSLKSDFSGVNINGSTVNRYVEFDVTPSSTYNFSVSSITVPITNNTNTSTMYYAVAYSTNGFTTFNYLTTNSSAGISNVSAINAGATATAYFPVSQVIPASGTLAVRVIIFDNKNSSSTVNGTVNLSNVVVAGTSTVAYASPVFASTSSLTFTAGTTSYNAISGAVTTALSNYTVNATTTSSTVTYTLTGAPTGITINSSTGVISGTPTTFGNYIATVKADNGNLFPTTATIAFNITGQALTPTVNTISPTTVAVDGSSFTLTVNGTNFVSGQSAVTWNGTALTTTYISGGTQLTAVVPASYIAATNTGTNPVSIGVTTTSSNTLSSSSNPTLSLTTTTPTITGITPTGAAAAGGKLTVYGTNFNSGSVITWGSSNLTTVFVSATQLTATIPTLSGSTVAVGVANYIGSTSTSSSASSQTFEIGNATATWVSGSTTTPTIVGSLNSTITTTATVNGLVTNYAGNGQIGVGVSAFNSYSYDGSTATENSTFTGIAASTATNTTTTSTRYIDFKVSPTTGYNLTVSGISIPVALGGSSSGVFYYSAAYSTDGTSFTPVSSSANTGGATVANTYDVNLPSNGSTLVTDFIPGSAISVPSGSTFIVRLIPWKQGSGSGSVSGTTELVGPLTIVGNSTQIPTPGAPTITALADDNAQVDVSFSAPTLTGTSAITSYKVYAYANGSTTAATSVSANVVSGVAPTHILVTGLTNNTSYQFKVSATNTSGEGTLSALSSAVFPSNTTTWSITNGVGSWDHGDPNAGDQNATINGNYTSTYALNCLKLTVNSGYTLSIANTITFTVSGASITNNGTITGAGTLLLNSGTNATAQTISGTGAISNLTINNTQGVSIISGMQSITGVLNVTSGAFATGGFLTLKSTSITNSAIVGQVGGSITGNAIVERYIPAGYRAYRDLASGVYNSTSYASNPAAFSNGSMFTNWQENGSFTKNGYGLFITGASATDASKTYYSSPHYNTSNGLDYSINGNASAYTVSYTSGIAAPVFSAITNTQNLLLDPFKGYRVLVRGDRSFNLESTPTIIYPGGLVMYNATTLRTTGQLITGNVTYKTVANGGVTASVGSNSSDGLNAASTGFSMVANPYVSPVQWSLVYAASGGASTSGLNASYWYLDPTSSATGKYIPYNALTGSSVVYTTSSSNNYSTTSAVGGTDYIQPGQAFFVQNHNSTSPQLLFTESCKAAAASNLKSVFGITAPLSKIYVSLLRENSAGNYTHTDGARACLGPQTFESKKPHFSSFCTKMCIGVDSSNTHAQEQQVS